LNSRVFFLFYIGEKYSIFFGEKKLDGESEDKPFRVINIRRTYGSAKNPRAFDFSLPGEMCVPIIKALTKLQKEFNL